MGLRMDENIHYLKTFIPLLVGLFFIVFILLEAALPLRKRTRPFILRALLNICLTGLIFFVGSVVVKPITSGVIDSNATRQFGLLHVFPLPTFLYYIAGFLLLDLTFYYWHLINHNIPLLWRFHNMHHVDPDLDVTTSFRFHVVEVTYATGFRIIQIVFIGISLPLFLIYELIFQLSTVFHHSNLRMPIKLERVINVVFVTPRMHGIHHSQIRNETNSNYSVIFRWWDQLHKTLRLNIPQNQINIGVPAYQNSGDNTLWHLIAMPFLKQRPYWKSGKGVENARNVSMLPPKRGMIVE